MMKIILFIISFFFATLGNAQCTDINDYSFTVQEGICLFSGQITIAMSCDDAQAQLIHPNGTVSQQQVVSGEVVFSDLEKGTYTLTMVDTVSGATSTSQVITISILADDFVVTPVERDCVANGGIIVSNACDNLVAELVYPGGNQLLQEVQSGGTTFSFLQAGTYTVTLRDQTTGQSTEPKPVIVTTTYEDIQYTIVSVMPPTCVAGVDGEVNFRITSGGIGPFRVSMLDINGSVITSQDYTRATPSSIITGTIQGTAAEQITSGTYQFFIQDLAGGVSGCGVLVGDQIVVQESPNNNVLCYEIEKVDSGSYFQIDTNCKYRIRFRIQKLGGGCEQSILFTTGDSYFGA